MTFPIFAIHCYLREIGPSWGPVIPAIPMWLICRLRAGSFDH